MPLSASALTISLTAAFGTAIGGVVFFDPINSYRYPSREGAMYLRSFHDYTNVQEVDGTSQLCGKRFARHYSGVNKDGKREKDVEVCFNDIFRAHRPDIYLK